MRLEGASTFTMPIIALPKTNLLDDVPEPVMDRWKRPTVDNSDVIEGVGQLARSVRRPQADARAFAAPGLGLAEIGEGISDVGKGVSRYAEERPKKKDPAADKSPAKGAGGGASVDTDGVPDPYHPEGAAGRAIRATGSVPAAAELKRTQARTAAQINDADETMAAHDEQFPQFMSEHPNEDEWETLASVQRAQLISELHDNPALTPEARDHISRRAQLWDSRAAAAVKMQATKATYARAKAGFDTRVRQAVEQQNPDLLEQTAGAGLQLGVYTPGEWQEMQHRYQQAGVQLQLDSEAQRVAQAQYLLLDTASKQGSEPALAQLDASELDEENKKYLRDRILDTARQSTAAEMDRLVGDVFSGKLQSTADVRARYGSSGLLKTPMVNAGIAALVDAQDPRVRQDRLRNSDANFVTLLRQVENYDPEKDPERTRAIDLASQAHARVGGADGDYLRRELWSRFTTGLPAAPSDAKDVPGTINDLLRDAFHSRRGMIPWEQQKVLVGPDGRRAAAWAVDPVNRNIAMDVQAMIKHRFSQWLAQAPREEITADNARKKFEEFAPHGTYALALQQTLDANAAASRRRKMSGALSSANREAPGLNPPPPQPAPAAAPMPVRASGSTSQDEAASLALFGQPPPAAEPSPDLPSAPHFVNDRRVNLRDGNLYP